LKKLAPYLIVLLIILSGCNVADTNSIKDSNNEVKSVVPEQNTIPEYEKDLIEPEQEFVQENIEVTEQDKEPTNEVIEANNEDLDTEIKPDVDLLYKSLYIGELNKSGFVYIEPFSVSRGCCTEEIDYENYPSSIEFYIIENDGNIYTAEFDSKSISYIPNVEEGSHFYWQGFAESEQFTLRYKSSVVTDKAIVGITLFNYGIENIDFSIRGNERVYSEGEYNNSLARVEEVNEINGTDEGFLREITLEDTIVGSKQICLISIKDNDIKILLSKYMAIGVESIANVYVIDFIKDGKVIQTFEKYNGVAY